MVLDARLLCKIAQVRKTGRLEMGQLFELADVVVQTHPGLEDGRISQDIAQRLGQTQAFELEDENLVNAGKLQERRRIALPLFVGRPSLSIKAEQGVTCKLAHCYGQLVSGPNHAYRPGPALYGAGVYLILAHPPVKARPVCIVVSHIFIVNPARSGVEDGA